MASITSLSRGKLMLFAAAAALSVANVYYAQPLLDALAQEMQINAAIVGLVVSATQIGCALALLLLLPLGDRVERRRLMAWQLLALVAALLTVASAQGATQLLLGMAGVGLSGTALTQGLIAYGASAAAPHQRGSAIGTIQSGVFIGLLLARVVAGGISDLAGWRGVYLGAAAAMLAIAWPLWRCLPATPAPRDAPSYVQLLASMWTLLRHHRPLRVRGTLALLMFAAFNIFWSTLVLPLSAPPWSLSHTAIGAFGLVGAAGALVAGRAGYWADRGWGQRTSLMALLLLSLAWWPLSRMPVSWPALMLGIVLLDLGGQALHVTNQSMILHDDVQAHGRLVGVYMLFYAAGSGLGAIAGTVSYAHGGWNGVCIAGAAVSVSALILWGATLRRRPSCARASAHR